MLQSEMMADDVGSRRGLETGVDGNSRLASGKGGFEPGGRGPTHPRDSTLRS